MPDSKSPGIGLGRPYTNVATRTPTPVNPCRVLLDPLSKKLEGELSIRLLKLKNAAEPDELPPFLFKLCGGALINQLSPCSLKFRMSSVLRFHQTRQYCSHLQEGNAHCLQYSSWDQFPSDSYQHIKSNIAGLSDDGSGVTSANSRLDYVQALILYQ